RQNRGEARSRCGECRGAGRGRARHRLRGAPFGLRVGEPPRRGRDAPPPPSGTMVSPGKLLRAASEHHCGRDQRRTNSMTANIMTALAHPARRRLWLTIGSGGLIATGLLALYGFGQAGLWYSLMVIAALLAGSDIAVRAWRALMVRHLSIELLVTVAAVGALVIGEVWEAAAVTFLFMFGAWLEMRTMGQTRGALKALLSAAPATAVVLRDGEAVEIAAQAVQPGETVLVK